jgi:hypothetical protein
LKIVIFLNFIGKPPQTSANIYTKITTFGGLFVFQNTPRAVELKIVIFLNFIGKPPQTSANMYIKITTFGGFFLFQKHAESSPLRGVFSRFRVFSVPEFITEKKTPAPVHTAILLEYPQPKMANYFAGSPLDLH